MFTAPRGTADILPAEQPYWQRVFKEAEELCRLFGYARIDTPIFEEAALFERGVGSATDIIQKEMYVFEDRSGEKMALRPEGTANVCRAYLQHGMQNLPQPVRLYYVSPTFRYERPQAGRRRQHMQFGCEAIGESDAAVDGELIELVWRLYENLGLKDLVLLLNTIGDRKCRPAYLKALKAYYKGHVDDLCRDCRDRYERNPLRLLDCKQESCQPVIAAAPKMSDHLCDECRDHFDALCGYLDALSIPYKIDPHLVRGLDYYTRTVFEVQPRRRRPAEHDRGRRQVRRANRGAGRQADARHRLRHGHRADSAEHEEAQSHRTAANGAGGVRGLSEREGADGGGAAGQPAASRGNSGDDGDGRPQSEVADAAGERNRRVFRAHTG